MVEYQDNHLNSVFSALADPTRRAMLAQLADGSQTISELADPYDMSLAGASKHVRMLERAGLIRRERQGRTHICRLQAEPLARAQDWLRHYRKFWNARLDTLETLLNEEDKGERDG